MNGETEKIWYIFDKGAVSGPFIQDEVERLASAPAASGMIWKSGQTEWKSIQQWRPEIPKPAVAAQTPMKEIKNVWYISTGGLNSGPYPIEEVYSKITVGGLPADMKLWTLGFKKWVGIFEISDVTRTLGIAQRRHRRAPFVGEVQRHGIFTRLFPRKVAAAQTISLGGMGLTGLGKLREGSKINLTISSDLLREPIKARGRVVYQFSSESGINTGIEFIDLDQAGQDVVADYVQQFE